MEAFTTVTFGTMADQALFLSVFTLEHCRICQERWNKQQRENKKFHRTTTD
jgi:hypothetical protein